MTRRVVDTIHPGSRRRQPRRCSYCEREVEVLKAGLCLGCAANQAMGRLKA